MDKVELRMAMRYAVIFEKSATGYGAYVPDLPGCIAAAGTPDEIRQLIREAIKLHLADMRASGQSFQADAQQEAKTRDPSRGGGPRARVTEKRSAVVCHSRACLAREESRFCITRDSHEQRNLRAE
jgi:predicted RNase H-like HicB family nuclease